MPDFLRVGDGKNSSPRQEQIQFLEHLAKTWNTKQYWGVMAPPGIGKSFIARTIQRTIPNTAIVTLNNALVDQYKESYPDLNTLKGKDFYETEQELIQARHRAEVQDTVFNPLSFYYFYLRRPHLTKPTTVVIDECHRIGQMLLLTVGQSFCCSQYQIPKDLTDIQFYEWVKTLCEKLGKIYSMPSIGCNLLAP